jgi:hypothetical protein
VAVNPYRPTTSATILPFTPRRAPAGQWLPEEIAECYRIVDLLGRTGLPVSLEAGTSDEGDPWLVFLREDTQDVIVHLARIDGLVMASSVANDAVFRGRSLREVLSLILHTQPLVVSPGSMGERVFMHPAAVLAAFVATALAVSVHGDAFVGRSAETDWLAVGERDEQMAHPNVLRASLHIPNPEGTVPTRTETTGWVGHAAVIAAAALAVAAFSDDVWIPVAPVADVVPGPNGATGQAEKPLADVRPATAWNSMGAEQADAVASFAGLEPQAGQHPEPENAEAPAEVVRVAVSEVQEPKPFLAIAVQVAPPTEVPEILPTSPVVHVASWTESWTILAAPLGPIVPDAVVVPSARAQGGEEQSRTALRFDARPGEILNFSWGELYWEAAVFFGLIDPQLLTMQASEDAFLSVPIWVGVSVSSYVLPASIEAGGPTVVEVQASSEVGVSVSSYVLPASIEAGGPTVVEVQASSEGRIVTVAAPGFPSAAASTKIVASSLEASASDRPSWASTPIPSASTTSGPLRPSEAATTVGARSEATALPDPPSAPATAGQSEVSAGSPSHTQVGLPQPLRGANAAQFVLDFLNNQSHDISISNREIILTEAVLRFNGIEKAQLDKVLFFSSQQVDIHAMMLAPGVALVNVSSTLDRSGDYTNHLSPSVDLRHGHAITLVGVLDI